MSAELIGREAFERTAAAVAASVEARARDVAQETTLRVAAGIRSRVRSKVRHRLAAAVKTGVDPAQRQFVVGFDDAALIASGLFPMVPVWHEFGTDKMTANPAVGDALAAERQRYLQEMEQAVGGVLEEASSR